MKVISTIEYQVGSDRLWRSAWLLAIATIGYNIVEGLVSVYFGLADETIALFGFGADSFIEVISAIGIAHLIIRLKRNGAARRDEFEKTALIITGWCFVVLTVSLIAGAGASVILNHKPDTTIPGVVISLISIGCMWMLISSKMKVGTALNSEPILADARCSKVCLRMSIVLLTSSLLYYFTGFALLDSLGALGLAWYSWKEGRECFEKSRRTDIACADDCC